MPSLKRKKRWKQGLDHPLQTKGNNLAPGKGAQGLGLPCANQRK